MAKTGYKDRPYLKHPLTGEVLNTTVMLVNGELVYGTGNVVSRLQREIIPKAMELGGRGLRTRDFIEAFTIRGPNYGDVVRQVMRNLQAQRRIHIRNVGTNRPRYVYDVVQAHSTDENRPKSRKPLTSLPAARSKSTPHAITVVIFVFILVIIFVFPIVFFIVFLDMLHEGNAGGTVASLVLTLVFAGILVFCRRNIKEAVSTFKNSF